jgi:RNA polymerase sigma-70 factor (family 1)
MIMDVQMLDEEKMLLQRMAEGDTQAFARIFDNYWKKIYSISLTYIKSTQEAEDVTQDVFLKIWKNREKLTEVDSLNNYLFIMTRNQVLTALRKKSAQDHQPLFIETGGASKDPLPDREVAYKDLQVKLHEAIRLLPPKQQEALRLSREEGLGHEEIARLMGVSKSTVKNHIVTGLNTVRLYLREHAGPFSLLAFFIYCSFFKK